MRIYISGKVTGDPNYRMKFNSAELTLTTLGHEVLNPASGQEGMPDADAMRRAVGMLLTADAVLMLPDWVKSTGAILERELAKRLRLPIIYARQVRREEPELLVRREPVWRVVYER